MLFVFRVKRFVVVVMFVSSDVAVIDFNAYIHDLEF